MQLFNQEDSYKVKLDLFEGPLDLLLYLIKKNEVDIYDIPIELITEQYLNYLSILEELNLNNVGEFILLASQLIYIKSQMLLPEEERDDEEIEDPRLELVSQLLEYKKFKNAAYALDTMQKEQSELYPRLAKLYIEEDNSKIKLNISVFDLLDAFSKILQSKKFDISLEIEDEPFTVAEKIIELREKLNNQVCIKFTEIFAKSRSRTEVICFFLAILEMIKNGEIIAKQNENFGEIIIQKSFQ